jgi:glycosyltransferase involved in cell wall biosynthesis
MRLPHVLFLNAAEVLGADVAVHLSLARTLDRGRIRVSAATNLRESPGASSRAAFTAIPDITVLPLDLGQPLGPRHGLALAQAMLYNARGAASLVRLAAWCRHNAVDIIHVPERPRQTLFGLFVARLAGCACLIHAHTGIYPQEATRLAKWRFNQAQAVVGVSRFTAASYVRLANVPSERVFAVHNAVDADQFRPEVAVAGRLPMRGRLGLPVDAPVIGCVARLTRWKAQHTLVEAFAIVRQRFRDARLVLPGISGDAAPDGNGSYRDYLIRRSAELGLGDTVTLPGFLPQSDMPEFYGALDVLAHPSIEEPFGLAVVEAMASERPVVAIDGGGIPEIIRDGRDGVLVPAEQPPALAAAITRVLDNPALAVQLGRAGRQRVVDTFTPELQAAAMLEVYEQVLGRRANHRRSLPLRWQQ